MSKLTLLCVGGCGRSATHEGLCEACREQVQLLRAHGHTEECAREQLATQSCRCGLVESGYVEKDDRGTPDEVFVPLHRYYDFTIDVAASRSNALLPRFYTVRDNGLAQSWSGERVWCNPPFTDVERWVKKASETVDCLTVMLVPANRTEQPWWQTYVEPYRDHIMGSRLHTHFIAGRKEFKPPGPRRVQTLFGTEERTAKQWKSGAAFGIVMLVWEDIVNLNAAIERAQREPHGVW